MTRLPKKTSPTGVINLDYFEDRFVFKRFDPSPRLVHFVDFYWSIQWEIDEGVHTQDGVITESWGSVEKIKKSGVYLV